MAQAEKTSGDGVTMLTGEDLDAIRQLVDRYNVHEDRGQFEQWADLWTRDGTFYNGSGEAIAGRENLAKFHKARWERPEVHSWIHWATNVVITPTASGANVESYAMTAERTPDRADGYRFTRAHVKVDEVRREDGKWRFQSRRVVPLAGATVSPGTATPASIERVREEVLAAEKERLRVLASGDYEALSKMYDDALTYTHMTGEVDTKEQFLARVKATVARRGSGSPFVRTDDLTVRIYGGGTVAVMTGSLHNPLADAKHADRPYRTTLQVWTKKADRWLLVAIQTTGVDSKNA